MTEQKQTNANPFPRRAGVVSLALNAAAMAISRASLVLYHRYSLHEGSGGAGQHRGGFGLDYEIELLRGQARASFVMDHGRTGPQGVLGGQDGAVNQVEVIRNGKAMIPEHLSKAQDIVLNPGDRVRVRTPGGGGYGDPARRDPALVAEDLAVGRYSVADAARLWPKRG